jgi:iron complex outermembrane recepter protein
VLFRARNELSLYSSYGEGFRANSGLDFAGNPFAANESSSFEGGANFQLVRGSLQGNVAVFQLKQRNMLTGDPVNAGFSAAIGEARSRGFEADLAGRYAEVDLHVSYAYTDAVATLGVLDQNFGLAINPGDRLINVPPHSLSALASRRASLAGRALTMGSGVLHVGERSGQTATTFTLPSYTVWRAFMDLQPWSNISVKAELDNVFDTTYYSNSFSTLWVQPGSPRRGRISTQIHF